MKLYTDRLILQSSDISLSSAVAEYYSENKQFLAPLEPVREDDFYTESYQYRSLQLEQASLNGIRFYIFKKGSPDRVIGTVALNNIVRGAFDSCFLGYKLSAGNENRGYMTEAVKAVVDFAFEALKLHRIEANIMPRNLPSLAVVRKCGFYEEGYAVKYLKINGVWEDHIHMVLRNEKIE